MFFKATILICALTSAQTKCTEDDAVAVVQGPPSRSLAECGFLSQAYIANGSLANYLDGTTFLVIRCTPGKGPGNG